MSSTLASHTLTQLCLSQQICQPALPSRSQDYRCAVCMEPFEAEEALRLLPCRHYFHLPCTAGWLAVSAALTVYSLSLAADAADMSLCGCCSSLQDHNSCPSCTVKVAATP